MDHVNTHVASVLVVQMHACIAVNHITILITLLVVVRRVEVVANGHVVGCVAVDACIHVEIAKA